HASSIKAETFSFASSIKAEADPTTNRATKQKNQ
ncbi:hypothetical protein CCACVL1_00616, partial [Corchorus capsularis]